MKTLKHFLRNRNVRKKTPLKKRPRRNAGDSTQHMIDAATGGLLPYWLITITLFLYSYFEFHDRLRQPWIMLSLAIIFLVIAIWKTFTVLPGIKSMKQGRDGEKRIAQYLDNDFRDDLTGTAIRIYHDIPGDQFNLDHVIICEKGIYVLETKTLSVPVKGSEKLLYKGGEHLYYEDSGKVVMGNPIGQVNAGVQWLKELLCRQYQFEDKDYPDPPVRGVLVLADRYVINQNIGNYDIWVLNQLAFAKFISNEANRLKATTIKSCGDLLDGYIRRKLDAESKKIF